MRGPDLVSLASVQAALGSAVLHFLWQGALIGLVAGLLLHGMRRRTAGERYAVAYGALLLGLLAFGASFVTSLLERTPAAGAGWLPASSATAEPAAVLALRPEVASVAAWCWTLGVLGMAVRFAAQSRGARRLRTTGVSAPDADWLRTFRALRSELGISRGVRFLKSALAEVPMVVGWLRPVVLVPASAFTGLGPDQLRALLAHELAHVRRHDHLLNAVQAVVEIALFFHPAVWWLSKQVRVEREYCCDDSAVRLTGDPRILARALATMEALRIHVPPEPTTRTVLAANGGPLMQRISRILEARPAGRTSPTSWHLPASLALVGALALAATSHAATGPVFEEMTTATAQDDMRPEARKVWTKLQAAVEAGELTGAEAREKFAAWRKSFAEKNQARKQTDRADPEAVRAHLKAAVEAGKLTKEQARERYAAWEKRATEERVHAHLEQVWTELQAKVKAGEITKAQAEEHMAAMKQRVALRMAGQAQDADPEAVVEKIAAAVEAGEITPEQGKARIETYKQHLAAQKAEREAKVHAVAERIHAAIQSGRITPEQGKERLEAFRKSLEQGESRPSGAAPEEMKKRLKAAIESGRITREQAEEHLKAYRKRLAEEKAQEKAEAKAQKQEKQKTKRAPESDRIY